MIDSTIIIEAGRIQRQYWRDLWRYRELMAFLAWRDVSVHYKQTLVGIAWAVIRPLATVAVFTIVFSKVAKLPSDGIPYVLLVLSGMLLWQLFSSGLSESSNSLVNNSNLISKVYFPRLLVPLSSIAVSLIDFLVCVPILLALMLFYGFVPGWEIVMAPLFVGAAVLASFSFGIWLCALNVRYRDVRYIVPFLVQFGLYISPVGFSSSVIPDQYRWLFWINPMVGIISGFRWALFGVAAQSELIAIGLSLLIITASLISGVYYFRHTERTFADII